jgi:hypothetical protein
MAWTFIMQSSAAFLIGTLGDQLGLHSTFFWLALCSLFATFGVLLLPKKPVTLLQE